MPKSTSRNTALSATYSVKALKNSRINPRFKTWAKRSLTPKSASWRKISPPYLQNVLKLPRGERVAVLLPNLLQYPIALFGILQRGWWR